MKRSRTSQFTFMPRAIYQIRFFLQQPSPIWKEFSIVNVQIHSQSSLSKDVSRREVKANLLRRYWHDCGKIERITFDWFIFLAQTINWAFTCWYLDQWWSNDRNDIYRKSSRCYAVPNRNCHFFSVLFLRRKYHQSLNSLNIFKQCGQYVLKCINRITVLIISNVSM